MRRHPEAGGKRVKARRRAAVKLKRRNAPITVRGRGSSAGNRETKTPRLTRERDEALEQLTAASEVLQVISSSPGDLQPVFRAILENATRICEAKFGNLWLREGDNFRIAATHGAPPAYRQFFDREPVVSPDPRSGLGVILRTKRPIHIVDIKSSPAYKDKMRTATIKLANARSLVGVPLLKENQVVGGIAIYRQEVRPFTDKQVALLANFAAQAVIAIENTRLLNGLRESLQQQTATADVLKVISRSTFDLQTVLSTLVESAARLCAADKAALFQWDGEVYRLATTYGDSGDVAQYATKHPLRPGRDSMIGRVALEGKAVHIHDVLADPEYRQTGYQQAFGYRTNLGVPLLRDGTTIGVFTLVRNEVNPFTEKQIELVTTFADQAVIAIENARLLNELRQRTTDLTESLEQQTATSNVLEVISRSAFDLQAVFETVAESSVRLCGADRAMIFRFDGELLRLAAAFNSSPEFTEWVKRHPIRPGRHSASARAALERRTIHIPDVLADPGYTYGVKDVEAVRTVLAVPILKGDDLLGVMIIFHLEGVRPFSDKQIALVETFADQAAIAIENVRLFEAEQQRTRELTESLEQQTATSEVLRVISSSPGDLQPVFAAMLENAVQICGAKFGSIYRTDGDALRIVATTSNTPPAYAEARRQSAGYRFTDQKSPIGRMAATKSIFHVLDLAVEEAYLTRHNPAIVAAVELGRVHSVLGVPMLKDNELIGAFTLSRQEVQAFSDKQIELVQNFAAQAVIAIENARLLNELRESLEQQTAMSDVLRIISSAPGDLEPVFRAMLENATRLCEAPFGTMFLRDGGVLRIVARHIPAAPTAMFERGSELVIADHSTNPLVRVLDSKEVIHIADFRTDPSYIAGNPRVVAFVDLIGARTGLCVPMLKDNECIGLFVTMRLEVRPFGDKQIELVKNFASQAVIAIENTRLLRELRQRTDELGRSVDELRALGETSQAVNSTLDLEAVLNTIVAKAVQLSGTEAGAIYVFDNLQREFHLRATYGMDQELITALTEQHIRLDEPIVAQVLAQPEPIQVADLQEGEPSAVNEVILRAGFRALLVAPLRGGEDLVGMLVVRRRIPGAFQQNTVDLMKTFAAQSALAIQNARLFHEIEEKSRQLQEASQHKSQFLANMSHELRTPLNAILGYTELMADGAYGEPSERMMGVLKRLESNGKHLLGLINDVLDLSKIEAGQLVLDLADYSLKQVADTVHNAIEPLAADKKLKFTTEVAPDLPRGHGDERRLTQVLLNLVGNAIKFTDAGEVAIKVSVANGAFNIAVQDTGPGISAADQAKLFQEFQQADNSITKKKGGTGLGLAISKRIVEMHGGRIWIASIVDQGSTFAFTVPVHVTQQVELS